MQQEKTTVWTLEEPSTIVYLGGTLHLQPMRFHSQPNYGILSYSAHSKWGSWDASRLFLLQRACMLVHFGVHPFHPSRGPVSAPGSLFPPATTGSQFYPNLARQPPHPPLRNGDEAPSPQGVSGQCTRRRMQCTKPDGGNRWV